MTPSSHQGHQRRTFQEPPSTEEISKLLSFSRRKPHARDFRDVVRIIACTGLRPRELSDLRWEQVDLRARFITISSDKSGATRRVPLSKRTARIFRGRFQRQPRTDYVLGAAPRNVLLSVSKQLRIFSAALGIRPVTLHSLRHAFAVRWFNSGGGVMSLASILGHKSMSCTCRTFFATPREQLRINAQQLEQLEFQMN